MTKKITKSEAIRKVYAPAWVIIPFFACLGAFISIAIFALSHKVFPETPAWSLKRFVVGAIIAAGLAYSIPTIKDIAFVTFKSNLKAWGFVLLVESIMVVAPLWLAIFALAFMAISNAYVAASAGLVQFTDPKAKAKKKARK